MAALAASLAPRNQRRKAREVFDARVMIFIAALIVVFAIAAACMLFARDSYANRELAAYQRTINEPWMNRLVALLYVPAQK